MSNNAGNVLFFGTRTQLPTTTQRGTFDIYRRTSVNGSSTLVTTALGGGFPNGSSITQFVSDDGLTFAFLSDASNLVAGDPNATARDCYVWKASGTALVSQPVTARVGTGSSCNSVRLSRNGQFAAMDMTDAMSPVDTNGLTDIYVRPVP